MTSTTAVDVLLSVVDLKQDNFTKIVDRYTIPRYVENLKTLHKYYEAVDTFQKT